MLSKSILEGTIRIITILFAVDGFGLTVRIKLQIIFFYKIHWASFYVSQVTHFDKNVFQSVSYIYNLESKQSCMTTALQFQTKSVP